MLTLIAFNAVPLGICAAIGFVTGLWMLRADRKDRRS